MIAIFIIAIISDKIHAQTTPWYAHTNLNTISFSEGNLPVIGTANDYSMHFFTNSHYRMIITNDKGYLGIGLPLPTAYTSSINYPQSKLHVHSDEYIDQAISNSGSIGFNRGQLGNIFSTTQSVPYTAIQITNEATDINYTDGLHIGVIDNDAFIKLKEDGRLDIFTKNTLHFTILNDGKTGIGIYSNLDARLNIKSKNENTVDITGITNEYALRVSSYTSDDAIYVQSSNNNTAINIDAKNTDHALLCNVDNNDMKALLLVKGNEENFTVYGKGNTQIGNSWWKLGIGSADGGNNLGYGTSYIGFNAFRDNGNWRIDGDGSHNGGGVIYTDITGTMKFIPVKSTGGGNNNKSDTQIRDEWAMKITGDKTVFMQDHLYVCKTVHADELIATDPSWCDYVFDEDYKLMSVSELEQYILKEKHLPDIPSAKQIESEGIKLKEMNQKMMEKIEELTLYIIELNKRIEKLEKQSN